MERLIVSLLLLYIGCFAMETEENNLVVSEPAYNVKISEAIASFNKLSDEEKVTFFNLVKKPEKKKTTLSALAWLKQLKKDKSKQPKEKKKKDKKEEDKEYFKKLEQNIETAYQSGLAVLKEKDGD